MIRQDFGFSPKTHHAGGKAKGEIGGFLTPAGEAAFYGKPIAEIDWNRPLTASGVLSVGSGGTNLLLGFFNSNSVNEWRTPNSLSIRINGRGDGKFFAYVEYCTAKWRAGADTTPFPSTTDPDTGRWNLLGFPCQQSLPWKIAYDPEANEGRGVLTATIGDATAECLLDEGHKADGARFNRFGILNVIKSADSGSEFWVDDVVINGAPVEEFSADPKWDGLKNRTTYPSGNVRPWFDYGFSDTNFAGGAKKGEFGGLMFRGDCRYAERMGCYGDRIGPLTLSKPLKASGKIAMTRGVTDSTTLFGFYHSKDSLRQNESQKDGVPESVLGIHIEGPSRDGFRFYPVLRPKDSGNKFPAIGEFPTIYPNGEVHDWSLDYRPNADGNGGVITVSLDDHSGTMSVAAEDIARGTTFDRFGIVSSWIDGNGQVVYWDDLTYTASQD